MVSAVVKIHFYYLMHEERDRNARQSSWQMQKMRASQDAAWVSPGLGIYHNAYEVSHWDGTASADDVSVSASQAPYYQAVSVMV